MLLPAPAQSTQGQALPSHVMEQLAGPVVLPSRYLHDAVAGFQENLAQYRAACAELEQVLGAAHDAGELGALGGSNTRGALGLFGARRCLWGHNWQCCCAYGAEKLQEPPPRACSRQGIRPALCPAPGPAGAHAPFLACLPRLPAGRLLGSGSPADMLQSLQTALANVHGLLIHAAARLQVRCHAPEGCCYWRGAMPFEPSKLLCAQNVGPLRLGGKRER